MSKEKIFITNKTADKFYTLEVETVSRAEVDAHIADCKAKGQPAPVVILGLSHTKYEGE